MNEGQGRACHYGLTLRRRRIGWMETKPGSKGKRKKKSERAEVRKER